MKKYAIIICFLLAICHFVLPAYAEQAAPEEDSSHISQEILDLIPIKEGDQVIRIFLTNIHSEFAKHNNIDELLFAHNDLIVYVVKSADGTLEAYRIFEGECVKMRLYQGYYVLVDTYLSGETIRQIDPEIEVEFAYYFCGETNISGNAIYYKTNLGDYVYYLSYSGGFDGAYLFSAENFFEAQAASYNHMLESGSNAGGISDPLFDLSVFQIGSPDFNPNAPFPAPTQKADSAKPLWLIGGICISVILVGAGTVFIILRQRKRNLPA